MRDRDFEMLKPSDLVEIVIPQTLKVEKRLIEGDVVNKVRFEVTFKENFLPQYVTQYVREILLRGGRVFYTESIRPLIIHSKESLKLKEQLTEQIVRTRTG